MTDSTTTALSVATTFVTVSTSTLGRHIGYFLLRQEPELVAAVRNAFDLA